MSEVLSRFSRATAEWFRGAFDEPTAAQAGAWKAVSDGANALVVAPTGSGKTLSAFLWSIDRLIAPPAGATPPEPSARTRVLYISPLKALGVDVERNLRSPLVGITQTAKRLGDDPPEVRIGVRSGDTTPAERRSLASRPPDILITTPESLYLMLTSKARETLRGVETVIIDEVHAVAASKRGAHLALSLERLDDLLERPAQRIGLSATVRPAEEVARFLGGSAPVTIVSPPASKRFELRIVVPVEDMTTPGQAPGEATPADGAGGPGSIWPHVEESIVDEVLARRSTIVFANSRRLAERLTSRLNEIYERRTAPQGDAIAVAPPARPPAELMGGSGQSAGFASDEEPVFARAHHGSVAKERRAAIEDDLKTGRLRCVVSTSSLELGIDMGDVDLVIQVESPPSVASGLQRIGRAGHQVGEVSRGVIFPKHRADLLGGAVTTERMLAGRIESIAVPRNPLDILAQQTIAAAAIDELDVERWFETVRRSAPFRTLPRSAYEATLDLLAGRYPSDRFGELRPRLIWDRDAGTLTGRPGAQRLAVTSGGTIPDRGMFGVFMAGEADPTATTGLGQGARVGELDEEMVYESRVGDVFALGASSWKIQEITHDRVIVTPAFGQPGRLPFWKGDALGRPAELGEALGAFTREIGDADDSVAAERLGAAGLDAFAAANLRAYLTEQRAATGQLPSDKILVVERTRDELGDWRVILHSPYGLPVHAPLALAVGARVEQRLGVDGAAVASDDGIIVRVPDTGEDPPGAELFVFEPDELERLVTDRVGGSALFASRFRECAARALLLPTLSPGKRSPLWQQRQRSAQLLDVARDFPTFPIILETVRECLQDAYDLPALLSLARRITSRAVRIVETVTDTPSPFARTLLFGYVGAFLYEGDSPLAERKATALTIDQALLGELLGQVELAELLDPGVIAATDAELQRTTPSRRLNGVEGAADLLRILGPLTASEAGARLRGDDPPTVPAEQRQDGATGAVAAIDDAEPAEPHHPAALGATEAAVLLDALVASRRALRVTVAGEVRWAAIEDAARLRDALGSPLPIGVPHAFIEPVADPLGDLIARHARTHGPFTTADAAARFGLGVAVAGAELERLAADGRIVAGVFLADAARSASEPATAQWCDAGVLRRLRSRSLAALRHQVEPVDMGSYGRFLPVWQNVGAGLRGVDALVGAIDQLGGVALPASAWESLVLPARVADYTPAMLDELTATGEVIWSGSGALPGRDGWVSLHLADSASVTLPAGVAAPGGGLALRVHEQLAASGAAFFPQIAAGLAATGGEASTDADIVDALWELVWAGLVSNDTLAPLRVLTSGAGAHKTVRAAPRARMYRGRAVRTPSMPTRLGPPGSGGRWALLPDGEADTTIRSAAAAEYLLDRHGVVTRGAVVAEGAPGGFALAYRVLSGLEDAGRCRRGYYIERLGAAQFATSSAVDRLRGFTRTDEADRGPTGALALAATDPANPYGAALPWPAVDVEGLGHRPARKAGSLVALVDGEAALYLERGGRSLLAFTEDAGELAAGAAALAGTVRDGGLESLTVEKVNGTFVYQSAVAPALRAAGFVETPKGLRLRRHA